MAPSTRKWWKEGVGYQVWPASFKDSNGDGLGDLPGIISKLDYLKDLGADFMWLSPCYDSPRHDHGYDIRNYEAIDPDFGTIEDLDNLIKGLHDRGMKLLLDLVINHTSDQHRWFQESEKSKDNEFSDYYIWRDPKIVDGKKVEPSNWASIFGGSAWKYVEARDQYYLHLFYESQPDLNWRNPKVRNDIYDTAIRFWLDRGIDGFRIDTVNLYDKDFSFPDAEVKDPKDLYHGPPFQHIVNGPRMHEWLQEQRNEVLNPYGDVVLVGELGFSEQSSLKRYLDPKDRELDMVFDFEVVSPEGVTSTGKENRVFDFSLPVVRRGFATPQRNLKEAGLWPTVWLDNHDMPRSITKFGSTDPALKWASGKLLALLLSTLSGTLFIYQGQEIGMSNLPKSWSRSDLRDHWWISYFKEIERKYSGDDEQLQKQMQVAINAFQWEARDHARTPIQWSSDEPSAGFSTAEAWMKPNTTYKDGATVADQERDESSLLNFWKKAVALRKSNVDVFVYGLTEFLDEENDKVLYYTKSLDDGSGKAKAVVVLNYSDEAVDISWPKEIDVNSLGKILLGTADNADAGKLQPREARVYELE